MQEGAQITFINVSCRCLAQNVLRPYTGQQLEKANERQTDSARGSKIQENETVLSKEIEKKIEQNGLLNCQVR